MSILELGPVIFGGTEGIIAFMKSKCIIEEYKIATCNANMQHSLQGNIY